MASTKPGHIADTIKGLAAFPDIRSQPAAASDIVLALRYIALCQRAGRDPLGDLAVQFGSVEKATAVATFSDEIERCWPEDFHVARPCCSAMTHDEATVARVIAFLGAADDISAKDELAGLVRPDRVGRLVECGRHASAVLAART